jgi:hypothetical protein
MWGKYSQINFIFFGFIKKIFKKINSHSDSRRHPGSELTQQATWVLPS